MSNSQNWHSRKQRYSTEKENVCQGMISEEEKRNTIINQIINKKGSSKNRKTEEKKGLFRSR